MSSGDVMVTESDLENYEVTERQPLVGELKSGEYRMISPPPPSGGVVLQYILRLLDGKAGGSFNWNERCFC